MSNNAAYQKVAGNNYWFTERSPTTAVYYGLQGRRQLTYRWCTDGQEPTGFALVHVRPPPPRGPVPSRAAHPAPGPAPGDPWAGLGHQEAAFFHDLTLEFSERNKTRTVLVIRAEFLQEMLRAGIELQKAKKIRG